MPDANVNGRSAHYGKTESERYGLVLARPETEVERAARVGSTFVERLTARHEREQELYDRLAK